MGAVCCTERDRLDLSVLDTECSQEKSSVFIVPGMCSNALEVQLKGEETFEVVYVNIPKMIESASTVFHELEFGLADCSLKSGKPAKTVKEISEGVTVRPVEGLAGCAHLDPHAPLPLIALWMPMIKLLSESCNLRAFNYDWRKWGDLKVVEDLLPKFKGQVEKLVEDGGKPVSILAHSMGAQVTLWMLAQLGEVWQKQNVKQIIFCAPAISGTPVLFPCYANGPAGNCIEGGMVSMPAEVADQDLTRITATFPCMMAEMPTNTGGETVWSPDKVFASTPSKKYTVGNITDFYEDAKKYGNNDKHWQVAPTLWPNFSDSIAGQCRAPCVPTNIIYSKSEKTLSSTKYSDDDISKAPDLEHSEFEGGDTTITGASIENLAEAWMKSGSKDITLYPTPEDAHVTHSGCINADFVMRKVPELISSS